MEAIPSHSSRTAQKHSKLRAATRRLYLPGCQTYGFIAILKQMAVASAPAIEINGMAGQQSAHHCGNRIAPGAQQQMKMIRDQRPGKAPRPGLLQNRAQSLDKIITVLIVYKDFTTLDTAYNNVVQCTRGVYAALSWDHSILSNGC
jgi:hypothetical protein